MASTSSSTGNLSEGTAPPSGDPEVSRDTEVEATAEKLDNFIGDLLRRYDVSAGPYLWPQEQVRWHELVFCLLEFFGEPDVPAETARATTEMLNELDLLGIEDLAVIPPAPQDALMHAILVRKGYDPTEAESALQTLHELAVSLVERHQGKTQRYLREYGERMLDEVTNQFVLSDLNYAQTRGVFAHWLQNVLSLPVTLDTAAVRACCRQLGVEPKELVAAADRHDLNLSVLDDLILEYMREQSLASRPEDAKPTGAYH